MIGKNNIEVTRAACAGGGHLRVVGIIILSMINDVPESITTAIAAETKRWSQLGTCWSGEERVAIAREARLAFQGETSNGNGLSEVAANAVHKIAVDAHHIDQKWITRCHERGLEPLAMVELLAITAKVTAVDTCVMGIGEELPSIPAPEAGEPSRQVVEGARTNHGWLPTKGRASAPVCFSAVADEDHAMHELHTGLYLSMEEMRDHDIVKELHRTQIELLAARTSYYNDCFY